MLQLSERGSVVWCQVNHSPSFTVDTPLDLAIKEELISDTIELVGIDPKLIKKMKTEDREEARNRLYNNAKVEIRLPPVRIRLTLKYSIDVCTISFSWIVRRRFGLDAWVLNVTLYTNGIYRKTRFAWLPSLCLKVMPRQVCAVTPIQMQSIGIGGTGLRMELTLWSHQNALFLDRSSSRRASMPAV